MDEKEAEARPVMVTIFLVYSTPTNQFDWSVSRAYVISNSASEAKLTNR